MYSTILFDIDGVLLSEERYFDASALTVHELLFADHWLALPSGSLPAYSAKPSESAIRTIREAVFAADEVLDFMKSVGVNANWDMVYLQWMCQWLHVLRNVKSKAPAVWSALRTSLNEPWQAETLATAGGLLRSARVEETPGFSGFLDDFQSCRSRQDMLDRVRDGWAELLHVEPDAMEGRLHAAYSVVVDVFQQWYLGDAETGSVSGKVGFVHQEVALAEPAAVSQLFADLQSRGIQLGIGTGRPHTETVLPFASFGWDIFFHPDRITTASDVLRAEEKWPDHRPLSKPNPFSYLRSWLGAEHEEGAVNPSLPLDEDMARTMLVVGDSVADWQAARTIGCDFAAVLTGLAGLAARETFENLGCTFILRDVLELREVLHI